MKYSKNPRIRKCGLRTCRLKFRKVDCSQPLYFLDANSERERAEASGSEREGVGVGSKRMNSIFLLPRPLPPRSRFALSSSSLAVTTI